MKKAPATAQIHSERGAPAVLNVASKWEEEARGEVERLRVLLRDTQARQLEENPEDDGKDWPKTLSIIRGQLEDAEKRWKVNADMVHKFDRTVDEGKRTAEESVTREEASRIFPAFVIYMRTAVQRTQDQIPAIRGSSSDEEGFSILCNHMDGEFESAMETATRESHLPGWVQDAVFTVLGK